MIVHSPQHFRPRRVRQPVSLADILPTLVELAGNGRPASEYCAPLDGRSLLPHLSGTGAVVQSQSTVRGEYLAEGALAPIVMLRRNRFKFIHTSTEMDQLFDLENDPDELHNLSLEQEELVSDFHSEVKHHWGDLRSLHEEVLRSQRRRRFVAKALANGTYTAWDWQPVRDARNMYVRSHIPLDDIEAMARFPRVEK